MADPESGVVQVSAAGPAPKERAGLSHLLKKLSTATQRRSAVEIPAAQLMQKQNNMKRQGSDSAESNKRMHELQSHTEVLGKGAAAQMSELRYDDVGKRQVEVEETFLLQRGILHPFNRFFRAWWWLTIVAAAVTGFSVPYTIAFLSGADSPGSAAYAVEATLLAIFLVDMLSSFFVARYDRGVLVGDRKTLIISYLRFRFWWDCLTVFPWDWIALASAGLMGSDSVTANFLSLLGLFKLGRMYRIDRLYRHLEFNLAMPLVVTKLTRIITYGFFLVHWAACGFWFIANQEEKLGHSNWLTVLNETPDGIRISEVEVWDQYTFSVWWAVSTFYMMGSGHGLAPYTLAEVIFTMVYIAVNILLWGFILGSITLLVQRSDEQSYKYRHRMHALERYGNDKELPQDMKELIEDHLRLHFTTNQEADEQMLATLPTTLRRRVLRHLYASHLQRCWLLANVKKKFFDALLGVARLETFMPQVELLTEGDEVNELMFVVGGYLEVFASSAAAEQKDRESLLESVRYTRSPAKARADVSVSKRNGVNTGYTLLGPGDVFGEVSFFTEVPMMELVRSLTVCRVLVVPRPAYVALAQDFPLSATAVLENLQRNAETVRQLTAVQEYLVQSIVIFPFGMRMKPVASDGDQIVSAEFRGGAASRLLRGSLVATLPGLSYQQTSAETIGDDGTAAGVPVVDATSWRASNMSGANSVGGLTVRQSQVVGNLQRIRALVKHHVAKTDESKTGQFLSAAAKGQADRVKLLLQQGYNPNTTDYDKRTALMLATANGHRAVVEMLLTVNANVNARDNMGRSALLEAAKASHDDILHLLLARGAKLGLDSAGQAQALCDAVSRGDINMLFRLIKCGADANSVDYDRMTALHIAAAEGNLQAAKVLVEQGKAQIDRLSRHGSTALDEARWAAVPALVEYFEAHVSAGEATASRKRSETRRADALLNAASSNDVAAIEHLLKRGCPPDACDYDKRTGLMLGAANGHKEVVSLLLSVGANPNARDNLGGSPLLEAVKGGHTAVLSQLVAAGATLQLSDSELASALCSMVLDGEEGLLRRYIVAGANVSVGDYDKRTPLHIAAAEDKLSMVSRTP
eukprot:gene6155-6392_t